MAEAASNTRVIASQKPKASTPWAKLASAFKGFGQTDKFWYYD